MSTEDAIVGAVLLGFQMVLRTITWSAERSRNAEEDDAEGERYRLFLEQARDDMSFSWEDVMDDSYEAIIYGWEFQEVTYKLRLGESPPFDPETGERMAKSKYDDGYIGWRKIAHRDQTGLERWDVDEHGGIRGVWHRTDTNYEPVYIPIEKGVLWRTHHAGNHPEGRSILRNSVRAWRFKRQLEFIEAVAIERKGAGFPTVRMPMGASVAENSIDLLRARSLVENIRNDTYTGAIIPPPLGEGEHQKWHLDLKSAESAGNQVSSDEVIRRYASEITVSTLAHFIMLAMNNRGAYALSRDQRDLWHLALDGIRTTWQRIVNRFLVEPLFELNRGAFPDRDLWPSLVPSQISQHDIDKLREFIGSMTGTGALQIGQADRDRIRAYIGWPEETKDQRERAEEERERTDEMAETRLEHMKNPLPPPGGAPQQNGPPQRDQKVAASERPFMAAEQFIGKSVLEWDDADWEAFAEFEYVRR
jgi:hypothetical protein